MIKKFDNFMNEDQHRYNSVADGTRNSKEIDEFLNKMLRPGSDATKAELLVVYINYHLSVEDRKMIKENI